MIKSSYCLSTREIINFGEVCLFVVVVASARAFCFSWLFIIIL